MIIVGVDARLAVERGRGWGRYAKEFLRNVSDHPEVTIKALLPDCESGCALSGQLPNVEVILQPPLEVRFGDDPLHNSMAALDVVDAFGEIDVFHSLTRFMADTEFKAQVATVHDIAPLSEPAYKKDYRAATKTMISRFIERNTSLIAISEFTKSELVRYGRVPAHQVQVIHQGVEFQSHNLTHERIQRDARRILYVGGAGENKNLNSLLVSAERLSHEFMIEVHLVGARDWGYEALLDEFERLENNALTIRYHGLVSDSKLSDLYSSADVFVFPSLHEGFGLPLVEAMLHQLPICCSDLPIMHEVVGEAGAYFNPIDVNSMVYTIENVLEDEAMANQMRAKGLNRSQQFNWKNSIAKTIDLYQTLVE